MEAAFKGLILEATKDSVRELTKEVDVLDDSEGVDPLGQISTFFEVKTTKYGGRGCFAKSDIPKGTSLLKCDAPIGSSVTRPFRKEVCTWCFHYLDGKTLKHRIESKIYFCSEQCLDQFREYDPDRLLASSLVAMEDMYLKCFGEIKDEEVPGSEEELLEVFESGWKEVDDWEQKVFSTKASKRAKFYPVVTQEDYTEIRYVISTLYSLYRTQKVVLSQKDLHEMSELEALVFEKELFFSLQSSELDKVRRYPYLLVSYMNIYKFIRLVAPKELLPFVNPKAIRDMIGRNLTNAFGIWSPTTQEGEEREFFGFGVYPSGSFFNHSCEFNVAKFRTNYSYEFFAGRDIVRGEELCISYGIDGDETVEERRNALKEWFFTCGCVRCLEESK